MIRSARFSASSKEYATWDLKELMDLLNIFTYTNDDSSGMIFNGKQHLGSTRGGWTFATYSQ